MRTVADVSQANATGVGGSTTTADATDPSSIGALKRMLTGSVSERLVENAVVNAASVNGRIGLGAVATVVSGRPAPMPPMPRIMTRVKTRPDRTMVECRISAPM